VQRTSELRRTAEGLRAALEERERAVDARRRLTETLDRQVRQLKATNRELDAFTYSVSHDLRAPLRAIEGFCAILLEKAAAQLDDEGRGLLDVVRGNAQKLAGLLDDLLEFSRIGRQALEPEDIDMSELARGVAHELEAAGRRVRWETRELPRARGDRALLRQVFVNLLANALKFSRDRDPAVIRIEGRAEGEETVYSVKDNGAGFDMRYADKLFGVFQRLHSSEEFEGTGVGLAIVDRVIQLHGGRVWAEGEVDRGATFHFALPTGVDKAA
jgi:two-component system sensor kinase